MHKILTGRRALRWQLRSPPLSPLPALDPTAPDLVPCRSGAQGCPPAVGDAGVSTLGTVQLGILQMLVAGSCLSATMEYEKSLPEILSQPASQTVVSGASATISVRVSGMGTRYQWYHEGDAIAGATSADFKLVGVQPAQAGRYWVDVSNSLGRLRSDPATLRVLPPLFITPLGDRFLDEDGALESLHFTVGDPVAPAASLEVGVESSNPALVPPSGLQLGGGGAARTLTVRPAANQSGSALITLQVRNPVGETSSTSFRLTVRPVNDAPLWPGEPPMFAQPGQRYSWTLGVSDPDAGDCLEVSARTLPSWLSLDASAGVLSGVPGRGGPEGDEVVLRACDGAGAEAWKTFRIWTEDNITVTNATEIEARRQALIQYIWGDEGWPTNREFRRTELEPSSTGYGVLHDDAGNLGRLHACQYTLPPGVTIRGAHFQALRGNRCLFVVHTGHFPGGFYDMDVGLTQEGEPPGLVIPALLREGYDVLALDMPLYDSWGPACVRLADGREVVLHTHNDLFEHLDRPMRYFVEPLVVALNHLQAHHVYRHIYMMGLSGGGWATTIGAALDPRIERSFPVAGSVPNYLRVGYEGLGDAEQDDSGFYRIANYKELYVMGAAGPNRAQLQLLNRYDSCCFYGTRHTNWVDEVTAVVAGVGAGTYRFWLDESHRDHRISAGALAQILDALPPDVVVPDVVSVAMNSDSTSLPLAGITPGALSRRGRVTLGVSPDPSGLLEEVTVDQAPGASTATLRIRPARDRWGTTSLTLTAVGDWSELATQSGIMQVRVLPPGTPRILSATRHAPAVWRLRLEGPAGRRAILQGSSDVARWVDLESVEFSGGYDEVTAPTPGDSPAGFYRLVIPLTTPWEPDPGRTQ